MSGNRKDKQSDLLSFFTTKTDSTNTSNSENVAPPIVENVAPPIVENSASPVASSSVVEDLVSSSSDDESTESLEPTPKKQKKEAGESHKYLKKWEKEPDLKGWLTDVKGFSSKAFCNICKVTMRAKLYNIKKHAKCPNHIQELNAINEIKVSSRMSDYGTKKVVATSRATKEVEIQMAAFVAAHTSLRTIDQFSLAVRKWGSEHPTLNKIRMGRTKCTKIITNVLAPSLREELVEDVGDGFYSIIVDESTDVSTKKMLCLVLKYVSRSHRRVITTFYRLIQVDAGDATTLAAAILTALEEDKLSVSKLVGIGTDGANVMIGANHSVFTLIKEHQQQLCLVRCQCHSLHLAASYACEKLPQRLEFLVEETYSYFSNSHKRQDHFSKVCVTLYGRARKILKRCQTRWLSFYECVDRIYSQWDALILHFEHACSTDRSQKAEILLKYYKDLTLKAFLIFVRSELHRFNKVNKALQSDKGTPLELVDQLMDFLESLLIRLVGPARLQSISRPQLRAYNFKGHVSSPHSIDFACSEFYDELIKIPPDIQLDVRKRCTEFLVEAAGQVQARLPENCHVLSKLPVLSVNATLTGKISNINDLARAFPNIVSSIDECSLEYALLRRKVWENTIETDAFWIEVSEFKTEAGVSRFENISKLALAMLALPFSNACVERCFSIMSIVKSKVRNRLNCITIDSIMFIRYAMKLKRISCVDLVFNDSMLRRFNSLMYESEEVSILEPRQSDDEDEDEEFEADGLFISDML